MFDTSKIGHSFPPFTVEIERAKIRELALAIGDNNPIYHSQQASQAAGYQDIPPSPTAGTIFMFWENTDMIEHLTELGLDVARLLHREEEYEYLAPFYPGETLTGVMTVLDGTTRRGPHNTTIDLVTLQLRYTNQQGQPVLIATTRFITRE
ncbi:MAG TPA: MaoC family dehydratase N-terminal domain-containing protein [Ktedonobacteraceae bacterium]|nr:MaoC family dehydratase N-terminal domain-containing protein [Ktedonobacteraceae bacterium]